MYVSNANELLTWKLKKNKALMRAENSVDDDAEGKNKQTEKVIEICYLFICLFDRQDLLHDKRIL